MLSTYLFANQTVLRSLMSMVNTLFKYVTLTIYTRTCNEDMFNAPADSSTQSVFYRTPQIDLLSLYSTALRILIYLVCILPHIAY